MSLCFSDFHFRSICWFYGDAMLTAVNASFISYAYYLVPLCVTMSLGGLHLVSRCNEKTFFYEVDAMQMKSFRMRLFTYS